MFAIRESSQSRIQCADKLFIPVRVLSGKVIVISVIEEPQDASLSELGIQALKLDPS